VLGRRVPGDERAGVDRPDQELPGAGAIHAVEPRASASPAG
jgi:hypothetical protein